MKNFIIFLLLLHVVPISSHSQLVQTYGDTARFKNYHSLALYTGLSNQISKDDVISPCIYNGWNVPVILRYDYQRKKVIHSFSIAFINTKLTSAIPNLSNGLSHYTSNLYFSLDYSYNMKIYTIPELHVQCFLGGKYVSFLNIRNHYYSASNCQPYFEQINSLGLHFILNKKFIAKRALFCFQIHTPFIAYSLYNNTFNSKSYLERIVDINKAKLDLGEVFKKGEFITVNKFFELQSQLSYTKFISRKMALSITYRFDYYSFDQYKNLLRSKYLISSFLLGFGIKL